MFARQVTIHGAPERIDDAIRVQQENVVPVLRECHGFRAQVFLVDRETGDVIGTSYWATEADMVASEEMVRPARQLVAQHVGAAGAPEIRIYEVPVFVTA